MANEIQIAMQESGLTLYAAARFPNGDVWDISSASPTTIQAINWSDAAMSLTEQGAPTNPTGDYFGNMVAPSGSIYIIEIFEQFGATPVRKDDWLITSTPVHWDGTSLRVYPAMCI